MVGKIGHHHIGGSQAQVGSQICGENMYARNIRQRLLHYPQHSASYLGMDINVMGHIDSQKNVTNKIVLPVTVCHR